MTPRLVAITDLGRASERSTLERFEELGRFARPGSVVFQLRDVELSARERMAFGRALVRAARDSEQLVVVNDRIDLARLLGADGVHLGESSIETADARRLFPARALVSRAIHDPEAVGAVDADLVLLSPVLRERKGRPPIGLPGLAAARAAVRRAGRGTGIFALGGVSGDRVSACLAAGADGVAVIGAVLRGEGAAIARALDIAR